MADADATLKLDGEPDIEGSGQATYDALASRVADGSLAKEYKQAAEAEQRRPNYLVMRSLLEAAERGSDSLFIDAPGSHPLTFTSRIDDAEMAIFSRIFSGSVEKVVGLDLSSNLLSDEGAGQLASSLLGPRAERLEYLSLKANNFGPSGCSIVCQALKHCPCLRRLDLSRNPLGKAGGMAVVELLRNSHTLDELYLADADLDIDVLVAVAASLLLTESQLKVCDLENPRLTTWQEEHTVHMGRMLRTNAHLCEIRLGKHRMRDEGLRQLVSFLVENKTLRVLDLRCNELGAEGAQHLGVLLSDDCQLAVLNLSGNRIGEKCNVDGARALSEALRVNRMLRALDLNHNQLCGDALQTLADALESNSTIEKLGLFHNQWDQPSSYKFHQVLNDRRRIVPLGTDFVTNAMELQIDICKRDNFELK